MFLDEFQILSLVAETKSFSKAARVLHLSQPAVSSKIQVMEDYYGVKLFTRTPHGVTLTEAGKMVCAYAIQFVDLHKSLQQDVNSLISSPQPSLTIGASCTVGNYFMPHILRMFKEKAPDVSIKLDIDNSKNILEKMKNADVDVAVVEGTVETPSFAVHHLDTLKLVFITSSGANGIKKKALSMSELKSKPFVLREEGAAIRVILEHVLAQHGYDLSQLQVGLEATSIHSVKSAVEQGFGCSLVPKIAVIQEIRAGTLKNIKIKEVKPDLELEVNLAYPANCELSTITQKFTNFMIHWVNDKSQTESS